MPTEEQLRAFKEAHRKWDAAETAYQQAIAGTATGDREAIARLPVALAARQAAEKELERAGAPFED